MLEASASQFCNCNNNGNANYNNASNANNYVRPRFECHANGNTPRVIYEGSVILSERRIMCAMRSDTSVIAVNAHNQKE